MLWWIYKLPTCMWQHMSAWYVLCKLAWKSKGYAYYALYNVTWMQSEFMMCHLNVKLVFSWKLGVWYNSWPKTKCGCNACLYNQRHLFTWYVDAIVMHLLKNHAWYAIIGCNEMQVYALRDVFTKYFYANLINLKNYYMVSQIMKILRER